MAGKQKLTDGQSDAKSVVAPVAVQRAAARGLEWRREFGRGGTAVGVARARDLANGRPVSPRTLQRMFSYFSRHAVDLIAEGARPGERGFPSAGRIAWELWGGDPGYRWVSRWRARQRDQD